MDTYSIPVAFIAGVVSFFAPCILPIIPGLLSYLAGTASSSQRRGTVLLHTILFVLGFTSVFATFGVLLNSVLLAVAYDVQVWAGRVGGLIIILFGIYLTGLISIPALEQRHVLNVKQGHGPWRYVTSFLFGAAFAAGWTPCVGAILGAILGLAASQPGSAFGLLVAYALGLGIPFIIIGFFADRAATVIHKLGRYAKPIEVIFGALLIVLGVMVFTGTLSSIASFPLIETFLGNA